VSRATRTKLLLLAVALVTAFLIFVPRQSDEREARLTLERFASMLTPSAGEAPEAHVARLERELPSFLASDVLVTLPSGESLAGREAVIARALALCRGQRPVIALRDLRATRRAKDAVHLRFETVVSDSQVGDLHAALRTGEAELSKSDRGWLLHRLEVGAERRAEPEPRP